MDQNHTLTDDIYNFCLLIKSTERREVIFIQIYLLYLELYRLLLGLHFFGRFFLLWSYFSRFCKVLFLILCSRLPGLSSRLILRLNIGGFLMKRSLRFILTPLKMTHHFISIILNFFLFFLLTITLKHINTDKSIGFKEHINILSLASIISQKLLTTLLVCKIYLTTPCTILTF